MKSVYVRILVWFLGTLALSMLAFILVTGYIIYRSGGSRPTGPELRTMMFEEAIGAYELGGSNGLVARLEQLHKYNPGEHFLTDAKGRDLSNGADRSLLLSQVGSSWDKPILLHGHFILGSKSSDNRYIMLSVSPLLSQVLPYLSFYVLILLAVGMICWALALSIASPLRNLAFAVDQFGRGNLAVRINSKRRDEIGAVGKAFDQMAERIEMLLASERRLLRDISHELRTPLARMSFAVELIKQKPKDSAILIKKDIDRLARLISGLLEMARAEEDPLYRNLETVRLDFILNEVVKDCRIEAAALGRHINFSVCQQAKIVGNSEPLRRAFENILRNAIRYTPEGSHVDIELRTDASYATIVVRDYGPGIPEELLSKIFQPFFRVDDSRNDSTGGIGLGLTIARRAIDIHHGNLLFANANPGLRVQINLFLRD